MLSGGARDLASSSVSSGFLAHGSTCERSVNWFIHGDRESGLQSIKRSTLVLRGTANAWIVLQTT